MTKKSLFWILMFAVLLTVCVVIIIKGDGDDMWMMICASFAVGFSVSAAVRNFRE